LSKILQWQLNNFRNNQSQLWTGKFKPVQNDLVIALKIVSTLIFTLTEKELPDLVSQTAPDGRRFYTIPDGTKLPSVTTVLGAQKKQAIMEWRKRVGEAEANRISKAATGRGTNVHTLCERYLNNQGTGDMMPDAKEMFVALKPELNRINNIHYQEQALWSTQLGMAGRVDCIAEFDGELASIDFKTSARAYEENAVVTSPQLALYVFSLKHK
jgi:genome maintenance exonuclease 1